ncbi:MAG: M20/M25/M40 family metallo-hydrolase, partial [Acetobacterales bacterium]
MPVNPEILPDVARLHETLRRLVAFDTQNPTGPEAEAAAFVAEEMRSLGCRIETMEVAPGRPNVIGVLENGPGPVFAFNTHMDVVQVGDGWSSDPFVLRERDGRLYGRGSCDAKGALAAMLEAMRLLAGERMSWSGTLLGVFVVDEESGSRGARAYAATKPKVDFCVIGEPTDCTTVIAHKGSIRPVVRVHGRAAHSGTPDKGVNAILAAAPLLEAVGREHERLRAVTHPLVGNASLSVTRVSGGRADNIVPDGCELLLDPRPVPAEDEDALRQELERLVSRAAEKAATDIGIA